MEKNTRNFRGGVLTTIYQRNIISLQYETKICIFLQNDTYVNIKTEPENRSCLYLKSIGKVYIRRILTKNPLESKLKFKIMGDTISF